MNCIRTLRVAVVLCLCAPGCGSDSDFHSSSGSTPPAGTDDGGTRTTSAASTSEGGVDPTDSGVGSTGGPTADGTSESGGGVPGCEGLPEAQVPCTACALEACAELATACCDGTDFAAAEAAGCFPLFECAVETGCVHMACYQPDTCMAEVDAAGGVTSPALGSALALGECLQAAAASEASEACMACAASME
ncbi:MAG: hypothetical protein JKY37_00765 [Nannocystaceae bacterium]|nr:hypothetical protein [Nannocystaceae bacterium]